jgi:hypothetical protein
VDDDGLDAIDPAQRRDRGLADSDDEPNAPGDPTRQPAVPGGVVLVPDDRDPGAGRGDRADHRGLDPVRVDQGRAAAPQPAAHPPGPAEQAETPPAADRPDLDSHRIEPRHERAFGEHQHLVDPGRVEGGEKRPQDLLGAAELRVGSDEADGDWGGLVHGQGGITTRRGAPLSTLRRVAQGTISKRLRGAARVSGLRTALKTVMRWLGFDLVKRHFYSPVPDFENISDDFWTRRSPLTGVGFDPDAQLRFLENELGPYIKELDSPRDQPDSDGFYLDNGTYGPVDAESLYAMVRHNTPKQVIEIGSGFSSLVIGKALAANREAGSPGAYEIIDPYPGSASYEMGGAEALRRVSDLREESILDVPVEHFRELQSGDLLFVDATHTVKVGSDVNRVVLDILPELAEGVCVHFHDVFLPYEYPREWVERSEWYWAEQYLLQAFLAFNDSFEVLFAANMLHRERREELQRIVPSSVSGAPPLAMWIRRNAG